MITTDEINKAHNEEEQIQIDDESQQEQEKLLIKIYEENIDTITTTSKIMQLTQLISILSFLIFLITITIRLSPLAKFSFFFTSIPLFISLLSLVVSFNMFLILKSIIDRSDSKNKTAQRGNIFSFVMLNLSGFLGATFFILLFLYIDEVITDVDLNIIFIPLYLAISVGIIYAVFISPAFSSNGLYIELVIIFTYLIGNFVFCGLLAGAVNKDSNDKFLYPFIAVYFFLGMCFLYLVINCMMNNKGNKRKFVTNGLYMIGVIFAFVGSLLVQLKKDNVIDNKDHYVDGIMFVLGFAFAFGESGVNLVFDCNESEEENNIIEGNKDNIY